VINFPDGIVNLKIFVDELSPLQHYFCQDSPEY
jgi:hypothetical protein